jgi:hypothetical protein
VRQRKRGIQHGRSDESDGDKRNRITKPNVVSANHNRGRENALFLLQTSQKVASQKLAHFSRQLVFGRLVVLGAAVGLSLNTLAAASPLARLLATSLGRAGPDGL